MHRTPPPRLMDLNPQQEVDMPQRSQSTPATTAAAVAKDDIMFVPVTSIDNDALADARQNYGLTTVAPAAATNTITTSCSLMNGATAAVATGNFDNPYNPYTTAAHNTIVLHEEVMNTMQVRIANLEAKLRESQMQRQSMEMVLQGNTFTSASAPYSLIQQIPSHQIPSHPLVINTTTSVPPKTSCTIVPPPQQCVSMPAPDYRSVPVADVRGTNYVFGDSCGNPAYMTYNGVQQPPGYQLSAAIPRKIQDLPSFSGQPEDWPLFYTAYVQSTAAYGCTNFENNQRLQRCLSGEAREVVKSLLIHPDNVGAIIDQLSFRFGRPEQLIRSQLNQVREIASIAESALGRLIPFATKTKNLAVFLQTAGGERHLANPTLLEELVSKLPMSRKLEWARHAAKIQPYPNVIHFSDWLSEVANLICTIQDTEAKEPKQRASVLHAAGGQSRPDVSKCVMCGGLHKVVNCKQLIESTVPERWVKVKRARLCFGCLKVGHMARDCRTKKTCSVNGCKKRHHGLLHETSVAEPVGDESTAKDQPETGGSSPASNLLAVKASSSAQLLFRVLPVTLYGPNRVVDTFALFDEGSTVTMLESDLIVELGLQGQQGHLDMQWIGGKQAREPTVVVNLQVSGKGMPKKHQLRNVYGISNLNLPVQSFDRRELAGKVGLRDDLPLQPYVNAVPKLLIGLDHCHLGLPMDFQQATEKGPYLTKTELGWVVFGPTGKSIQGKPSCLLTRGSADEALHNMVAEYFEMESFGVRPSPPIESKADVRARAILEYSTKRVGDRFQTGLLWKDDNVELPSSYSMAERRLESIERRMKRDENFAAAYGSIIKAYVEKGYCRKLQSAEAMVVGPRTWYLPHFGVVNPNKPAKLRLVFDAAAEVNGVSLNSKLMKGPQQYKSLPSVLFHFREGAVAVCGDIREMFHQVLIQQDDRCAQRFLWRDGDSRRQPDVYEMGVMTFGAACSPCAAEYVKTINAMEHRKVHPRAVTAILDHHYVDDFVDSFGSEEEALEVSGAVKEIHKRAGFELRNFSSNSRKVVDVLEGGLDAVSLNAKGLLEAEKVLGLYWRPTSDSFNFRLQFHHVEPDVVNGERCPTKRELLSVVMSVFDPLGFLSHFTISAKLLMRDVWRSDVRWDDPVPGEVVASWEKWRQQLSTVIEFSIPRFYFRGGKPKDIQLHVLVDASEDAFAAVAYWRVINAEGEVQTSFVCAKTRCAPLKPLTIPRLELQAAVLGTRLLKTIQEEHSVDVARCILWSDSTTVLSWINSEHRRYKPFVAHRVAEILSASEPMNWKWIPTSQNTADEATRYRSSFDFSPSSRWLNGPEFLVQTEDCWPTCGITSTANPEVECEEIRPKHSFLILNAPRINFEYFSSLSKLTRSMAWVIRFARSFRMQSGQSENGLTASELNEAERFLCGQVQMEAFSVELKQIGCGKVVEKESVLYNLSPYTDNDGILRVQGRIDAASWLPYATRRPTILPPVHTFTTLVVKHYHERMKHQNTEAAICEIRRKYWIPRLRQVMRGVVAHCYVCRISKVKPIPPLLGPLPEDRVTPYVRPFSYTGLDFFGPVSVTVRRRVEKRWVALFTCLTVRAIHLEVVHDLSTDACIVAIRNFINRRGVPVRVRSDNGTNFVGVNREAKRFSTVFDCKRVQREFSSRGVEWLFNCPLNPSEGGVWERMVQCVKRVLVHTLKEVAPQEHTFQCLLIEAENVVNSRPLTHLPVTADQEEPLTPNHFLLGSANTAQTPSINEQPEKLCSLRKQWRIARQLRDRFWKRWVAEYLPTLTRRTKWCQRTKPLTVGDLVFVCEPNVARRQWYRGRVERVYVGADGVVRKADIRSSRGLMRRPTSRLAVLDVESGESGSIHGGGNVAERTTEEQSPR